MLPIGFHAFGLAGRVMLPMHLPVLLAGFLTGPLSGFVVGILAPGLSYLFTSMPPAYAVPLMSLELPAYGLMAGLLYKRFHLNIILATISAMFVGRLIFALSLFLLGLFMEMPYDVATFVSASGPLMTGLPGIIVQLLLIPTIVATIHRRRPH